MWEWTKSDVDAEKKQILTDFIKKVYADQEFQTFMSDMGMKAWEADDKEILDAINKQTEDMKQYVELLQ